MSSTAVYAPHSRNRIRHVANTNPQTDAS